MQTNFLREAKETSQNAKFDLSAFKSTVYQLYDELKTEKNGDNADYVIKSFSS